MSILCKICGLESSSMNGISHHITKTHKISVKEYYDTYFLITGSNICPICGKETTFLNLAKGYSKHCSQTCTHLDKEVQKKYEATMQTRYGITHPFQNAELNQKANANHPHNNSSFSRPEVVKRISIIRANKLNEFEQAHQCTQVKKINDKYNSTAWKTLNLPVLRLGRDVFVENQYLSTIDEFMRQYEITKYQGISLKEKELVSFIKQNYKGTVITNSRKIISPYEIDIYLPDKKLAIEFNGTWYHSVNAGKAKNYHITKSKLCREQGIRLVHIYEFEDLNIQKQLLVDLLNGIDNYPICDFNKNNLLDGFDKVKPVIINSVYETVYGVGQLYGSPNCQIYGTDAGQ